MVAGLKRYRRPSSAAQAQPFVGTVLSRYWGKPFNAWYDGVVEQVFDAEELDVPAEEQTEVVPGGVYLSVSYTAEEGEEEDKEDLEWDEVFNAENCRVLKSSSAAQQILAALEDAPDAAPDAPIGVLSGSRSRKRSGNAAANQEAKKAKTTGPVGVKGGRTRRGDTEGAGLTPHPSHDEVVAATQRARTQPEPVKRGHSTRQAHVVAASQADAFGTQAQGDEAWATQARDDASDGSEDEHERHTQAANGRKRNRTRDKPLQVVPSRKRQKGTDRVPVEANGDWFGHIKDIRAQNFMCHENFAMPLGPHVNFVSGVNGSGKSAILQAAQACLGVSARQTGRGTTLKNFIKNGAHSASVSVSVWNTGREAVQPEVYGSWITIDRSIGQSGSSFAIKNQWDEKVGRGTKDEVDQLLDQMNINATNPVVIMTQDTARSFACDKTAKDMYDLYMSAMQFDATILNYGMVEECMGKMEDCLQRDREALDHQIKELKVVTEQLAQLEEFQELENKKRHILRFMLWAQVYLEQPKIDEARDKLQTTWPKFAEALHAKRAEIQQQTAVAQQQLQVKTDALQQFEPRSAALTRQLKHWRAEAHGTQRLAAQTESRIRNTEESLKALKEEQMSLATSAKETARQVEERAQKAKAERQKHLQTAESKLDALKAHDYEVDRRNEEVRQWTADAIRDGNKAEAELREANERVNHFKGEIKRLQSQQSGKNDVSVFGRQSAVELVKNIRFADQSGQFHRTPIGPIGTLLSIKDDSWAAAVEKSVGGLLDSFIVHDHHDVQKLKECARTVNYANVNVIQYPFTQAQHNIRPEHRLRGDLRTVESVLNFKQHEQIHTVKNVLIDQGAIERSVLVGHENEALEILNTHPQLERISKVWCADGGQAYRKGRGATASTTFIPHRGHKIVPRLVKDAAVFIDDLQRKLRDAEDKAHAALRAHKAAVDNLAEARAAQRAALKGKKDVNEKKAEIESQLEDLRRHEAVIETHAAEDVVTEKLQTLSQEILSRENQITEWKRHLDEVTSKDAEYRQQLLECESQISALKAENQDAAGAVQQTAQQLQRLNHQLVEAEAKLQELAKATDKVQQQLQQALDQQQRARDHAEQVCAEDEFPESKAYLREAGVLKCDSKVVEYSGAVTAVGRVLAKLDKQMERREKEAGGTLEELQAKKCKLEEAVQKNEIRHQESRSAMEALNHGLHKRRETFKSIRKTCAAMTNSYFKQYLQRKGWTGELKVEYSKQELHVRLVVDGKSVDDLKALSGGERSFTTLCFMMAVGSQLSAPFHCMDEFDVFMDPVVRRTSMISLLHLASTHLDTQFIFLSPQEVGQVQEAEEKLQETLKKSNKPELPKDFLRVHRMKPPQRPTNV